MEKNLNKLIHQLYFRLMTFEQEMVADTRFNKLSVTEVHLIMLVAEKPRSIKELTNELCISKGPVSLTVKKLHKLGYIWREKSTKDKRSIMIGSTAKGRSVARIHDAVHQASIKALISKLSDMEQKILLEIIEKLAVKELKPTIPIMVP